MIEYAKAIVAVVLVAAVCLYGLTAIVAGIVFDREMK